MQRLSGMAPSKGLLNGFVFAALLFERRSLFHC